MPKNPSLPTSVCGHWPQGNLVHGNLSRTQNSFPFGLCDSTGFWLVEGLQKEKQQTPTYGKDGGLGKVGWHVSTVPSELL